MKNTFLILFNLVVFTFQAQTEIEINRNIQAIKISTGLQVDLVTNADSNKIVASADVINAINYKVDEYELKISLSIENLIDGDAPLRLRVFTKKIDRVNAIQGSVVRITNSVKSDYFSLRAAEGSRIIGDFNTTKLEAKVLSGGILELSGKSNSQEVTVNTGGIYKGRDLKTKATSVKVSYGGEAEVNIAEDCEAKVFVGGEILIFGNPKYMNKKTSFGGNIRLVE